MRKEECNRNKRSGLLGFQSRDVCVTIIDPLLLGELSRSIPGGGNDVVVKGKGTLKVPFEVHGLSDTLRKESGDALHIMKTDPLQSLCKLIVLGSGPVAGHGQVAIGVEWRPLVLGEHLPVGFRRGLGK